MSDEIVKPLITGNLSEEGKLIKSKRKFPIDSIVNITLELPDFQELQLTGEVVGNISVGSNHIGQSKSDMGIHLINPYQEFVKFVRVHLN